MDDKLNIEVIHNPPEPTLRVDGFDVGRFCYDKDRDQYYHVFYSKYNIEYDKYEQLMDFVLQELDGLNNKLSDKTEDYAQ